MITKVEFKNLGTLNKNMVNIYGEYKNQEYSCQRIEIYYSYQTPIHYFYTDGYGKDERYTRVNDWSTTTGKFINELEPDKAKRVSGNLFEGYLELALMRLS